MLRCGYRHAHLSASHMKNVFEGGPRAPIRASVAEGSSSLCGREITTARATCLHTRVAPGVSATFERLYSAGPRYKCLKPAPWGRMRCKRAAEKHVNARTTSTGTRSAASADLRLGVSEQRRQPHFTGCAAVAKYMATVAAVVLTPENTEGCLARLAVVHDFVIDPHNSVGSRATGHRIQRSKK